MWLALSIVVVAHYRSSTIGPALVGPTRLTSHFKKTALLLLSLPSYILFTLALCRKMLWQYSTATNHRIYPPPSKAAKNESGMARTKATARRRPTAKAIDLDIGLDGWLGPHHPL